MSSRRQIFKSSAIIGGASAINIAIGIAKVKVLAVLLGPAGVGLMGLYQNIMGMASTLAGCGMGNSGARQLAASSGEAETLAIVRRALWLANLVLGLAGMAILWLLREPAPIAHRSGDLDWNGRLELLGGPVRIGVNIQCGDVVEIGKGVIGAEWDMHFIADPLDIQREVRRSFER